MAIVDEMFSESDTLKTELEVTTVGIEHAAGSNWGVVANWGDGLAPFSSNPVAGGDLGQIATDSSHEANLYVFMTGSVSQDGLGLAFLGTVCDFQREMRLSINQYESGSDKGGDAYTAEVYDIN